MWKIAIISMGFLLSPRAFMVAGSGIGLSGYAFFAVMILLALMHSSIARTLEVPLPDQVKTLFPVLGYGIRAFTLLFFSCSILGVAGYAFNEVYLYWFPNFLFSFIILVSSFFVSLTSAATFRNIQMLSVCLVILGVVILTLASLGAPMPSQAGDPEFYSAYTLNPFREGLVFMASLLIGYELFRNDDFSAEPRTKSLLISIGFTALLLSVFAAAIFSVSGAERLADSTVPHMIGARKILGQTGRYIMGGVVILGSFTAFNTILRFFRHPLKAALDASSGGSLSRGGLQWLLASAIPAFVVSVLLLMGYAGEPVTETYIAGGLAFWLLFYAVRSLCVFTQATAPSKGIICISSALCVSLAYGVMASAEDMLRAFITPIIFTAITTFIAYRFKKRLSS